MQKIVINASHGGFELSTKAMELYAQLCEAAWITPKQYDNEIDRDCLCLVETVETLGKAASTKYSNLKVVEIPQGIDWQIHESGGRESIAEAHRTWS